LTMSCIDLIHLHAIAQETTLCQPQLFSLLSGERLRLRWVMESCMSGDLAGQMSIYGLKVEIPAVEFDSPQRCDNLWSKIRRMKSKIDCWWMGQLSCWQF
jgi:hypothetical protein